VESRPAANDRGVLAEEAVAVQLDEVGEGELDVVEREGAAHVPRDLHLLEGGEVPVHLRAQLGEAALERRDLNVHTELALPGRLLELIDLPLQLHYRLLEIHGGAGHLSFLSPGVPGPHRAAPA